VEHRRKQRGVASGPDRVVLVGPRRRLASSRIDEHDSAPALADNADPTARVAHRHQAPVGRCRVRAEDQKEVRSIDVRDRQARELAEHAQRGE
jgi:hypothetical protein